MKSDKWNVEKQYYFEYLKKSNRNDKNICLPYSKSIFILFAYFKIILFNRYLNLRLIFKFEILVSRKLFSFSTSGNFFKLIWHPFY